MKQFASKPRKKFGSTAEATNVRDRFLNAYSKNSGSMGSGSFKLMTNSEKGLLVKSPRTKLRDGAYDNDSKLMLLSA